MEIKYKIIEAHPDEHMIVVRYYTAAVPEEALASQKDADGNVLRCRTDVAITLPIPVPTDAALNALIMRHCPVGLFELKEAVLDPTVDTSLSSIADKIGVEFSAVVVAPPPLVAFSSTSGDLVPVPVL